MPELVAGDDDTAVAIATGLMAARAEQVGERAARRRKLATSPLCDADGFARKFAASLRSITN